MTATRSPSRPERLTVTVFVTVNWCTSQTKGFNQSPTSPTSPIPTSPTPTSPPQNPNLKLGVGKDDPGREAVRSRPLVHRKRHPLSLCRQIRPNRSHHIIHGDVLVVLPHGGFTGGSEDGLRQTPGLLHSLGQGDPAGGARRLVVAPAAADEIPTHHALHGQHVERPHQHHAPGEFLATPAIRHLRQSPAQQVVGHQIGHACKPVHTEAGEHLPLAGDLGGHDDVVGRDAVTGDNHQTAIAHVMNLPDLPPEDQAHSASTLAIRSSMWRRWCDGSNSESSRSGLILPVTSSSSPSSSRRGVPVSQATMALRCTAA